MSRLHRVGRSRACSDDEKLIFFTCPTFAARLVDEFSREITEQDTRHSRVIGCIIFYSSLYFYATKLAVSLILIAPRRDVREVCERNYRSSLVKLHTPLRRLRIYTPETCSHAGCQLVAKQCILRANVITETKLAFYSYYLTNR